MMANAHSSTPWGIAIAPETVEDAITIGKYLILHAKAAFAEMGADPVVSEAKHLLRWIERAGVSEFTKREAFEGTKGRFKTVEKMVPGLNLLVQHGYIREKESEKRPGRGRPSSPGFEVNPRSQNSHYSQNQRGSANSANPANCATAVRFPETAAGRAECQSEVGKQ